MPSRHVDGRYVVEEMELQELMLDHLTLDFLWSSSANDWSITDDNTQLCFEYSGSLVNQTRYRKKAPVLSSF